MDRSHHRGTPRPTDRRGRHGPCFCKSTQLDISPALCTLETAFSSHDHRHLDFDGTPLARGHGYTSDYHHPCEICVVWCMHKCLNGRSAGSYGLATNAFHACRVYAKLQLPCITNTVHNCRVATGWPLRDARAVGGTAGGDDGEEGWSRACCGEGGLRLSRPVVPCT